MAAITVALAGDTMLGRGVAETLREAPGAALLAPELLELCRSADLFVCNLECCVSSRGSPWAAPGKPFHFRAPPLAAERLAGLGVDLVTLANNHALDFGPLALEDTIEHLAACGVAAVGAGHDLWAARRPARLRAGGLEVGVVSVTDHPEDFAAGVDRRVLYDLGDFLDDYAVDPVLRNDLGLLFLVRLDERGPRRLEAVPLELGYCHTRLAAPAAAAWIARRFRAACAALGTEVSGPDERLEVTWS